MSSDAVFSYRALQIEPEHQRIACHYEVGHEPFVEELRIPGGDLSAPGVREAATLYFLLAGASYYKTRAPGIVDLGTLVTTELEQAFLRNYLIEGLGEFAYKNELDLSGLRVEGPLGAAARVDPGLSVGDVLIPFGGGIDSIVTVAELSPLTDRAALFIAERPGARFEAIEESARRTGLEILRAERLIDAKLLESEARGYLNGHVPVTGILSALAILTALSAGYGAVAMSNEHSASSATLQGPSGPVNHQWSKGIDFEEGFRAVLAERLGSFEYFSWLRSRSELSVAASFAHCEEFHDSFRSCNQAFHQDPARRLECWCGTCDKCLFVDLILAPYLSRAALSAIFDGHEPLESPGLQDQLEVLVGTSIAPRPFECVGSESECRQALLLAAQRRDRADSPLIQALAKQLPASLAEPADDDRHHIPERYATRHRLG
jgi:hypothetical protein